MLDIDDTMASPTPKSKAPRSASGRPAPARPYNSNLPEVVDPAWILKALGIMLAAGLFCAYLTVCFAFHYTQWQLVLHPSRTTTQTPTTFGLAFTEVHFAVDGSGQPQLDGWLIPAESPSASPAALLLHGGDGSMADALPDAKSLHDAGLTVLLFDYRGFGRSGGAHPTQSLMQQDATDALNYLLTHGHAYPSGLFVYATGLGDSLAVQLCAGNHGIAGLILTSPDGDFESRIARLPSTRLVPVRWLFDQRFPLADPLHHLSTPKLLLSRTGGNAPEVFLRAADPRLTVEIPPGHPEQVVASIRRFLDSLPL